MNSPEDLLPAPDRSRLPVIAILSTMLALAACRSSSEDDIATREPEPVTHTSAETGDQELTAPFDGRPLGSVDVTVTAVKTEDELLVDDVDCERRIRQGGLPIWAAGAGIDSARFVVSDDDLVLGVLWADPLVAGEPTSDHPNNKILWVVNSPRDGHNLEITATPLGRTEPVVFDTFPANSGPGEIYPSIVDVPEPGCWQLELRWADNEAMVLIPYVAAQP